MYKKTDYDFYRQVDPLPFDYTTDYAAAQATTRDMAMLRLGWLLAGLGSYTTKLPSTLSICDVGAGNGEFYKACLPVFKQAAYYDVAATGGITKEQLYGQPWDVVTLHDVLEHFEDIEELFEIQAKYFYLSFPETPDKGLWPDLKTWRHYKPDEHIWLLNKDGVVEWLFDHGYTTIQSGFPEDIIRKPQEGLTRNIGSVLAVS